MASSTVIARPAAQAGLERFLAQRVVSDGHAVLIVWTGASATPSLNSVSWDIAI